MGKKTSVNGLATKIRLFMIKMYKIVDYYTFLTCDVTEAFERLIEKLKITIYLPVDLCKNTTKTVVKDSCNIKQC